MTAYPIGYAVWLSLQRYDLRFPDQAKFIGLANYGAVLTSPYWWQALKVTVIITVISVAIELVLGMVLAIADAPHAVRPGHGAHVDPDPVRHRHRRRGVQLAVRLDAEHRLPVGAVRRRPLR